MTEQTPPPPSRLERVLATMVVGVIGLSIVSFVALLFANPAGVSEEDFGQGLWLMVRVTPLFGLPLGFLLIIALLVVSTIRRRQGQAPSERG